MKPTPKKYTPNLAHSNIWKGVKFDSLLEARWAKTFHLLGWNWHKPTKEQGFLDNDIKKCWLPDFRILTPDNNKYLVEVKPHPDFVDFKKFNNALRKDYAVGLCFTQPKATETVIWRVQVPPLVLQFPENINEIWAEAEFYE